MRVRGGAVLPDAEAANAVAQHERSTTAMTAEQAVDWLRDVDGELFRTRPGRGGREAWVAVVRAPRPGARAGNARLIVALGETLEEATSVAAHRWRDCFRPVGALH